MNTNEIGKKKSKPELVLPTLRLSVKIDKPSSENFTEYNYNKLVLKTLVSQKSFIIISENFRKSSEITMVFFKNSNITFFSNFSF